MAYDVQLFTNNAVSLLQAPISATATSLTVMTGHGAMFPAPTAGQFFLVTLENQTATTREIIRVTGRVGDTFTFPLSNRGQEGTTPQAWDASLGEDTLVDHRITAETMRLAMRLPEPGAVTAPGAEVIDDTYSFVTNSTDTVVTLSQDYAANSTRVHVGGLRLKRNVDFIESAPFTITLLFRLTQANMDDGSALVIDYVAA